MFSINALIMIIKINAVEFILARRPIIKCLDPIKINISPINFIKQRQLTIQRLNRHLCSLHNCRVYKFMIIFSILLEVKCIWFELVNSRMNRNLILLEITEYISNILIIRSQRTSLSLDLIFIKLTLFFLTY